VKFDKPVIALTLVVSLIRFPLTPILLNKEVFVAYSANLYLIQIVVAISSLGLPELAHDWLSSAEDQDPRTLIYLTPIAPLFLISSFVSLATVFLLVILVPSFLPYTKGLLISFLLSLIVILSVLQLVLAAIQRHCSSRIAYFLPQLLRSGLFIILLTSYNRNLTLESLLSYELLIAFLALILSFAISFTASLRELVYSFRSFSGLSSIYHCIPARTGLLSILKGIHLSSYISSLVSAFAANADKLAASSLLSSELFFQVATMLVPANLVSALTSQLIQVKAKAMIEISKTNSSSFFQYLLRVIPHLQLWPIILISVPTLFSILDSLPSSSLGLETDSRFPLHLVLASSVYSISSVTLIVNMCLYALRKHSFILLDGFVSIASGLAFLVTLLYTSNLLLSALVFAVLRIISSFLLSLYVAKGEVSFS
jgi:hypothetical protein